MLDNFAKGLETLSVLKEIQKEPAKFEEMFVHCASKLEATSVIEKIKLSQKNEKVESLLHNFIKEASRQGT